MVVVVRQIGLTVGSRSVQPEYQPLWIAIGSVFTIGHGLVVLHGALEIPDRCSAMNVAYIYLRLWAEMPTGIGCQMDFEDFLPHPCAHALEWRALGLP
jgi:hypothetical protein